jgi:gamma-glutamylcysteine synthetase
MKMLKKMAALLLAGVMALALFTACGDNSAPSFAQTAEEKMFAVLSESTGLKENDTEMKNLAAQTLDKIKDGKVTKEVLKVNPEDIEKVDNKYRAKVSLPIPDLKAGDYYDNNSKTYTVLEVTPDNLANVDTTQLTQMIAAMKKNGVEMEKIGVSAKTVNGKTYIAVGMQMSMTIPAQSPQ